MNTERQQQAIAQVYPPLFPDTHPLDRSLLALRVMTPHGEVFSGTAEAARVLGAYFEMVLHEFGNSLTVAVPRIGDADWDELFVAKDRRLILSAVNTLRRVASGLYTARDVRAVERILNELQRRRRACDTYEEITLYDRALDLL